MSVNTLVAKQHLTATTGTRKEGNVLFNDTLNTFYLRLYGVRHMVKDHSDREIGNPLPPHGYSFQLTARVAHTRPLLNWNSLNSVGKQPV